MTAWRIRAVLLPGGETAEAGITEAGTWTSRPVAGAETLPGRFVLPGLVDAHCHLGIGQSADGPVALGMDAVRANLARARQAGVTAIRDTGSPGSLTLRVLAWPGTPQIFSRISSRVTGCPARSQSRRSSSTS